MGGMISQHIAARYPQRILSLTSVMSTTGNRRVQRARKEAMQVLANRPMSGDKEALIADSVNAARVTGSPAYPSAEDRLQAPRPAVLARVWCPQGGARPMAGAEARGSGKEGS